MKFPSIIVDLLFLFAILSAFALRILKVGYWIYSLLRMLFFFDELTFFFHFQCTSLSLVVVAVEAHSL